MTSFDFAYDKKNIVTIYSRWRGRQTYVETSREIEVVLQSRHRDLTVSFLNI